MKMKYIVTEHAESGVEEIFIFPVKIDHDCMAEVIGRIKNQSWGNWEREFRRPISAGFTDCVTCWGHSETLNLSSREEDSKLLRE